MNIVITMAGLGSRFTNKGYTVPKFMIKAGDKTLFELSLISLSNLFSYTNYFVFVTRVELNSKNFIMEICNKLGIKNIKIIEIDYLTDGQATTAKIGVNALPKSESVLIYNIDTFIEPGVLKYEKLTGDGSIPCFKAPGDHWSFVKGEKGIAEMVTEKERISKNCSVGAYYFKSSKLFLDVYNDYYSCAENFKSTNKEKYIAPMYNFMIKNGMCVTYFNIDSKYVHILGTPEELSDYLHLKHHE